MKNNFYAYRRTVVAVCLTILCAFSTANAQTAYFPPIKDVGDLMLIGAEIDSSFFKRMQHIYGALETNRVPKGLLLDYAFEYTSLDAYNGATLTDSNYVDEAAYWDICRTLMTARINTSTPVPDLGGVAGSTWFDERKPGQITLAGLYYHYSRFRDDAVSAGRLTVSNDQVRDKYSSGVWQNPYQTENVFAISPATTTYDTTGLTILLPTSLFKSNDAAAVSSMEIDAGDGLGYRTFTTGQPMSVSYSSNGRKELKYKLTLTNGTILQSHSEIYILPDGSQSASNLILPFNKARIRVTSTEAFEGKQAKGFMTIHYSSNDRILDKPLIVVEGFDPGYILNPELRDGFNSIGSFIAEIEDGNTLQNILLDYPQYDIVYVDWENGTDNIKRNALLLKTIIRKVNTMKASAGSQEPNVIIGQSMGGLITRWALKDMESQNEVHQTRLFVSYDTPHQGANVPLGYQHLARHVQQQYIKTNAGLIQYFGGITPHRSLNLIEAPATRQMLINYVNPNGQIDNTLHAQWQSELAAIGYPQGNGGLDLRLVAISNGAECGEFQGIAPNGLLMNLSGKANTRFIGDLIASVLPWSLYTASAALVNQPSFLLGIIPGRNDFNFDLKVNAVAHGGGNRVFYNKVTYKKTILWMIPITSTLTEKSNFAPSGQLAYDSYAGGYYPVPSIDLPANISVKSALIKYNINFSQAPSFNFVPTTSALDIGQGNITLTHTDYITKYTGSAPPVAPKNSPFDNFTTGYSNSRINERHTSINFENGNWLAEEILATNTPVAPNCTFVCRDNTIVGPATICTSAIYSIANMPAGVTAYWAPVTGLTITPQNATGSEVLVTRGNYVGQPTLQVSLSNGACSVNISKIIKASMPPSSATLTGYITTGGVSRDLQACNTLVAGNPNFPDMYSGDVIVTDIVATSFTWTLVSKYPSSAIVQLYEHSSGIATINIRTAGAQATYRLTTSNSCGSTSQTFIFRAGTACLIDSEVASGMSIYPNPTTDEFAVSLTSKDEAASIEEIVVQNRFGQIVKNQRFGLKSRSQLIDISNLPSELYVLRIFDGKKWIVEKVLKQ